MEGWVTNCRPLNCIQNSSPGLALVWAVLGSPQATPDFGRGSPKIPVRLTGSHWPVTYVLWCSPRVQQPPVQLVTELELAMRSQAVNLKSRSSRHSWALWIAPGFQSIFSYFFPACSLLHLEVLPSFSPFRLFSVSVKRFFSPQVVETIDYLNDLFQRAEARPHHLQVVSGGCWLGNPECRPSLERLKAWSPNRNHTG